MKIKVLLPLILLNPAIGCISSDKHIKPKNCAEITQKMSDAKDTGTVAICIVLCDFSESMDTASIRFVKLQAQRIFNEYYGRIALKFYGINGGSNEPFFQADPLLINKDDVNLIEYNQYRRCQLIAKEKDSATLGHILNDQAHNRPKATCIIQAVENAVNSLHQIMPDQKAKSTLFLISDMLESGTSSLGKFNLEDHDYTDDINALNKASYEPAFELGKNVNIQVAFYTQHIEKLDQLTAFWNLVFQKFGYRQPVILSGSLKL